MVLSTDVRPARFHRWLTFILALFLLAGCGDSAEDFVVTNNNQGNGATTGSLTFNFARAQSVVTVPTATTEIEFRFFSGPDGTGTSTLVTERPFNNQIVIENVPVATRSVEITARGPQGEPLADGLLNVTVAPGGNTVVDTTGFTLTNVTATDVTVSPPTATVLVGGTQDFNASVEFSNGETITVSDVEWTATGAAASVNAAGLATGLANGVATITATRGTVSGDATLTVNPVVATGELAVELDAKATSEIFESYRVRLIQGNEVVVQREFIRGDVGTPQTLTLRDLPAGEYQMELYLLDDEGATLGTFEDTITIVAGDTTTVLTTGFTPLTFLSSSSRVVSLPLGSAPFGVTAADFDEDGIMDLAAIGQESDVVYVLIGNADGSYDAPVELAGLNYAREIINADLNEDGNVDLVVANWSGGSASIFFGNGDGTFDPETPLAFGSWHAVQAADLNGDGHLDLVGADDGSNHIDVLLGDGAGNFAAQATVPAGEWVNRIVVADFNGDGDPDLAFTDREDVTVSVAFGNGDGTFDAREVFGVTAGIIFSLAVGDVDGDGDLDLVPSSRNGSTVPVLINDGAGSFTQGSLIQTGTDILWVELADVNGDGVLDLLASAAQDSAIYTSIGIGDGTFRPATSHRLQSEIGPFFFLVEDINDDGILDVVSANRGAFGNQGTAYGPASLSIFYGD
jgi:hypothetical protein